jgi:hypothetical protein
MMSRFSLNARIRPDGIFGNDKSRKVARPTGRTDICLSPAITGYGVLAPLPPAPFSVLRKIRCKLHAYLNE